MRRKEVKVISVLLIWTFMAVTVYIAGTAVVSLMGKCGNNARTDEIIMAGITAVTVYAQIFSLFSGVSYAAVIVLCLICVLLSFVFRDTIKQRFCKMRDGMSCGRMVWYLILIFVFALGTSHGYMHYDSDLYHAQAIHWIESYGIVPGLGNLHSRLAYNSSSFALTALYSFAFVNGQSYHVCAGFISLLLMKVYFEHVKDPKVRLSRMSVRDADVSCKSDICVDSDRKSAVRRRKSYTLRVSDFVRIAAAVYVFGIFGEMVSPESDYFALTTIMYIFIRWIDHLEAGDRDPAIYAGLSMLAVWAVTVKLSVAVLLLFALYPVALFIKEKHAGEIVRYVICAAVIVLPYLIRNVIISGWILYPSTVIDICGADWKIPKAAAAGDAKEIMIYGRGYSDVAAASGLGINEWFGHWFGSLGTTDRILTALSVIAVAILIVLTVVDIFGHLNRQWKASEKRMAADIGGLMFASWIAAGSFLFWLLTSPLIRYGRALILLFPSIIYGQLVTHICMNMKESAKECWMRVFIGCFALLISYKTCILIRDNLKKNAGSYIADQQDYGMYDTEEYKIGSLTVYRPTDGDRTGYYDFPSAPYSPDIEMRGDDVKDGFRPGSAQQ